MQLEKRNRKILIICPNPQGFAPGQRLKYEQYFEHWRTNGFDVEVSSFISVPMQRIVYTKGNYIYKIVGTIGGYLRRVKDIFRIRQYDIIYLFLWGTPFGPPIFEWLICKLAKKIIYDIDDMVFLKNINHEKRFLALLKGKNKPIYMMKHADHVITCTPYLNAIVRQFNENTTDISSTINTNTYIPVNRYINDHELVIGWSGSHSTSQYLYLLKDVFIDLQKSFPFKLLVMGDPDFFIPGIKIEAIPWKEEWEIEILQKIDIGVYPLPLDDEWVKGKSGLKALQYMALGIPAVATDVGCNNRVITHSVNGFLVKTHDEWMETLIKLITNPSLREDIGIRARKKVEEEFSIKANAKTYLNILKEVSS